MESKIWLIGGTRDSVVIAKMLSTSEIPFIVTVTTQSAQAIYPAGYEVVIGCMDEKEMQSFCQQQRIRIVVDASHPYAVEVSHQAIAVSTSLTISYLRYERINYQPSESTEAKASIIEIDSFDTLLAGNYLAQQQVLLTVGCKVLPLFKSWQSRATLFARVLPKMASLEMALAAGFTSDRLITIRPPITAALEKALWQQWNISLVITKASGKAGGEDIKREVAADLNIPLIIITRPPVVYPQQTSRFEEVLVFCSKLP